MVGTQVLMSRYEDSVAAANAVIGYLEQHPGVLTQVDTVGWYDGSELVLHEREWSRPRAAAWRLAVWIGPSGTSDALGMVPTGGELTLFEAVGPGRA